MGKRGPPPQPSILKYIRGNPSKERLNEAEPTPDLNDEFDVPESLAGNELALRKWHESVPVLRRMRVLTEADVEPWSRYCLKWADWMQARDKCKQFGRDNITMEPDPNRTDGKLRIKWTQPHSWAVEERALHRDLLRLEQEFGLTPSSRSQVTIHANPADDPIAAFVKKRSDSAGA